MTKTTDILSLTEEEEELHQYLVNTPPPPTQTHTHTTTTLRSIAICLENIMTICVCILDDSVFLSLEIIPVCAYDELACAYEGRLLVRPRCSTHGEFCVRSSSVCTNLTRPRKRGKNLAEIAVTGVFQNPSALSPSLSACCTWQLPVSSFLHLELSLTRLKNNLLRTK